MSTTLQTPWMQKSRKWLFNYFLRDFCLLKNAAYVLLHAYVRFSDDACVYWQIYDWLAEATGVDIETKRKTKLLPANIISLRLTAQHPYTGEITKNCRVCFSTTSTHGLEFAVWYGGSQSFNIERFSNGTTITWICLANESVQTQPPHRCIVVSLVEFSSSSS